MIESDMDFSFLPVFDVEKFDDLPFYRDRFNNLPTGKGIDFLATNSKQIVLLEVKNCRGHEADNRWRIFPDNKKRDKSNTKADIADRSSLDIEMAEKVAMTLACLLGAYTQSEYTEAAKFSEPFMNALKQKKLPEIKVILFLEGDFASFSRSKNMIMLDLANSIKKKLSWLACQVWVEDSTTCKGKYYSVGSVVR